MPANFNPYKQTQITTASPEKLLLMLYDGAISNCRQAQDRLSRKDLAGKGVYIGKALAIVGELLSTLNHEVGGDIAVNLERLYMYVMDELTRANVEGRAKSLDDAMQVMSTLREAWTQAIEQQRNERCLASAPAPVGRMAAAG
ncbi:flagellar export chaperone FliS [Geomesophilobacter sediminis]|uniref:Flagellar secretion chaperone FliS n=1 Tax=Geomesophilobacter sediminis TaxID=2798584 RepID=A0A8J7IXV0_9BACT|nr:flagellar export chaperone FliS [Geomesophilobacter sediminis]MBJ6724832.1 flagellar export chaperone FliS [Geomesophilobacter sediminis]